MDYDGITNAAVLSLQAGESGIADHVLSTTDRRDALTATARRAETKGLGAHVGTACSLNGERVSPRAVQLLLRAYGEGGVS